MRWHSLIDGKMFKKVRLLKPLLKHKTKNKTIVKQSKIHMSHLKTEQQQGQTSVKAGVLNYLINSSLLLYVSFLPVPQYFRSIKHHSLLCLYFFLLMEVFKKKEKKRRVLLYLICFDKSV